MIYDLLPTKPPGNIFNQPVQKVERLGYMWDTQDPFHDSEFT